MRDENSETIKINDYKVCFDFDKSNTDDTHDVLHQVRDVGKERESTDLI